MTPFVDVVLVLLVVFIVTAKLIVARGVEIDKPKAADRRRGPEHAAGLGEQGGELFVNGDGSPSDPRAVARDKEIAASTSKPKAIIAAIASRIRWRDACDRSRSASRHHGDRARERAPLTSFC